MMFLDELKRWSWEEMGARIRGATSADVDAALNRPGRRMLEDFCALVSPAAAPHLEALARESARATRQRFGRTMQLYAPMYLSNECQNICTYCGFSLHNRIPRLTLSDEQILAEVRVIKELGFDHILLVSGESRSVGVDYFEHAIRLVRPHFAHISLEVQPLEQPEYERLMRAGVSTVLVYQETYHEAEYRRHHPKGRKSNFAWRLATPDRLGAAGMYRIGLGVLLGLEEWRTDAAFLALHLGWLRRRYWRTRFSISFPRLRPAAGVVGPQVAVTDRDLVQLLCAFRLFDDQVDLSLSTRESPLFRDHVARLGVTSMSAGSKTEPGGYAGSAALKQFEISDERSPAEVAAMLRRSGLEPVWKDWDQVLEPVSGGTAP